MEAGNILRAEREPWLAVDPNCTLDILAEVAEFDRDRIQKWAQLHVLQVGFSVRRHGFRRARNGPRLNRLIALADHAAELLTEAP